MADSRFGSLDAYSYKFMRCPKCRSYSMKPAKPENDSQKKIPLICENCGYQSGITEAIGSVISEPFNKNDGQTNQGFNKIRWLMIAIIAVAVIFVLIKVTISSEPPENKTDSEIIAENKNDLQKESDEKKMGEETQPIIPDESDTDETKVQSDLASTNESNEADKSNNQTIAGYIDMQSSSIFGANWKRSLRGVRITTLSAGPFQSAGIMIGDLLKTINNKPISRDKMLLDARDEVLAGKKKQAIIGIERNGLDLYFILQNTVIDDKEDAVLAKDEYQNEKEEPSVALSDDESGQAVQPVSYKVADEFLLRIRNSAPDTEGQQFRWRFKTIQLRVKRSANQQVYIAGNETGTEKWAVDDSLVVNQQTFKGILESSVIADSGIISPSKKMDPLNITHLVPAQKSVTLTVSLYDHGIQYGNTEIFLIVK